MKPFFFGSSSSQLYGVYHPAIGSNHKAEGYVLCYPFGQEYMRAHRAFRQIAVQLSKNGYHVLRFDYRGTGDSAENLEDMKASDWLDDIDTAVEELKSMTGIKKVSLIGLRMGALLANMISKQRNDIERLIVWDPISSGSAYEEELLSEMKSKDVESWNFIDKENVLHFNGFALTQTFRESLKKIDMLELKTKADSVLQVVSKESLSFSRLRKYYQEEASEYKYSYSESPSDWNYVDDFGGILLPQPVIKTIVEWVTAKTVL